MLKVLLRVDARVTSTRAQPGGFWLVVEDSASREYMVKGLTAPPLGERVDIAVRPRIKKNGEGLGDATMALFLTSRRRDRATRLQPVVASPGVSGQRATAWPGVVEDRPLRESPRVDAEPPRAVSVNWMTADDCATCCF